MRNAKGKVNDKMTVRTSMRIEKLWAKIKAFNEYVGATNILFAGIFVCIFFLINHYKYEIQLLMFSTGKRELFFEAVTSRFTDFMTLTYSILVEAIPFVILGVLLSVIIQVFLPTDKIIKRLPKNNLIRRAIVSCLGIFMPVCECGNVPVARGLIAKGFSVQEAIIFLLAAPSVNIITFIVTWEAFSQNHSMAIVRVLGTIIIANIVAFIVSRTIASRRLLTSEFTAYCEMNEREPRTVARAASLFRSEMWLIIRLLVIGALIAAASQIFIPREVITAIGSDIVLSVVAMLILAFVISICSSVDAFFALAYVNTFSMGSLLAFLVSGPMVDIKMIVLMKSTFTTRTIVVISASVLLLSFILGLVFSYVW